MLWEIRRILVSVKLFVHVEVLRNSPQRLCEYELRHVTEYKLLCCTGRPRTAVGLVTPNTYCKWGTARQTHRERGDEPAISKHVKLMHN